MKYSLYILILLANVSFADYSNHPEANDLIDSLVNDHDFERSYVLKVLETAQKQNKILDSMSSPAELHGHGIGIKNYSWKKKELQMENSFLLKTMIYLIELRTSLEFQEKLLHRSWVSRQDTARSKAVTKSWIAWQHWVLIFQEDQSFLKVN